MDQPGKASPHSSHSKAGTDNQAHLEKHYADLSDKPFFPRLVDYSQLGEKHICQTLIRSGLWPRCLHGVGGP